MRNSKVRFIILALLIAFIVYIVGYFSGSYQFFRSNSTVDILNGITDDIRPKPIAEIELENKVNGERNKLGLVGLAHNDLLHQSACLKLDDMIAKNYWSHESPDGLAPWAFFSKVEYKYRNAGENLAYGFKTPDDTIGAWMNSPTHKANIVGDYAQQGMCSRVVKFQGGYYNLIVNHFGTPF